MERIAEFAEAGLIDRAQYQPGKTARRISVGLTIAIRAGLVMVGKALWGTRVAGHRAQRDRVNTSGHHVAAEWRHAQRLISDITKRPAAMGTKIAVRNGIGYVEFPAATSSQ